MRRRGRGDPMRDDGADSGFARMGLGPRDDAAARSVRTRLLGLAAQPRPRAPVSPDGGSTSFDYLENACAWLALAAYPNPAPASSVLGLASAAKNLTFWTSGAVLLGALGLLVIAQSHRRLRPRAGRAGLDASGASH